MIQTHPIQPDLDRVRALLRAMVGRKVAVVGDAMLDRYLIGNVGRISPEAPVPVFDIEREETMLGGAANVAKCLVALGATVELVGVVGDDPGARTLREEAANVGVGAEGLITAPDRPTTLKTRVVARQQQMLRLDRENAAPLDAATEARLAEQARAAAAGADAVILSDYAKGVLSEAVCRAAIEGAAGKPVVVDPKHLPWDRYRGATVIKPNRPESAWFFGGSVRSDDDVTAAGRAMIERLGVEHALITRSEDGMTLVSRDAGVFHVRPRPLEVHDVTGCGDVAATAVALAMSAGATAAEAAYISNAAASVKAGKFGTAAVSDSEILATIAGQTLGSRQKVMTREQAAAFAADLRRKGKRVVFTNGCFDILHLGHVTYLEHSRQRGDALIVGINTDASVRRLKGPGRPVQNEDDRARIIASQACVDGVVLFDEDTPLELITAVRPDVLTKGADYGRKENVVGHEVVERHGGRVELIDLVEGRSTTSLIEKAGR